MERRTWEEFRKLGLLWFINRILHVFGWVIVVDPSDGSAYPARCEYRGFSLEDEALGYKRMQENFTQNQWHDTI
jgi:hypothetical protein